VKTATEYSKKAKALRKIVGFICPLLMDAKRATTTAAIAMAIGVLHVTEDQL
jgi:hypothetical protein